MKHSSLIWQHSLTTGCYQVFQEKPAGAILVHQVHGAEVASLSDAHVTKIDADGIFWTWDEINSLHLPTVLTADCLPIVIIGSLGGAILHAGWRGVRAKIYAHPKIQAIKPKEYFIGPSIQFSSFEVTQEFFDYFPQKEFFQKKGDRFIFNLQAQTIYDLKNLYPGIKGEDSTIDTFTDLRFQSYRRDKKNRTNNYNVFSINPC